MKRRTTISVARFLSLYQDIHHIVERNNFASLAGIKFNILFCKQTASNPAVTGFIDKHLSS